MIVRNEDISSVEFRDADQAIQSLEWMFGELRYSVLTLDT
jgi:hypothetical protein